jgi:hypothetical protein
LGESASSVSKSQSLKALAENSQITQVQIKKPGDFEFINKAYGWFLQAILASGLLLQRVLSRFNKRAYCSGLKRLAKSLCIKKASPEARLFKHSLILELMFHT